MLYASLQFMSARIPLTRSFSFLQLTEVVQWAWSHNVHFVQILNKSILYSLLEIEKKPSFMTASPIPGVSPEWDPSKDQLGILIYHI